MQATLFVKKDDKFDIIGASEVGIDLSEYQKSVSIPLRELKDESPVAVAEVLIQESHNIEPGIRWVRPGDIFSIGPDYYVYADIEDSFLVNKYMLLPSWPTLIIFKVERNAEI